MLFRNNIFFLLFRYCVDGGTKALETSVTRYTIKTKTMNMTINLS